ncbi:MAG: Nif11-like leader peptide family natural product precursor [Ectothiorhodospiraceae bacterium]|nr:Nif11-like leader peptide family natural product precursor [Ectothiorhodospiraceae bacterium]
MSKKSLEAFMARLEEDAELRAAARGLAEKGKGTSLGAVTELARKKGYDFTAEEVSGQLAGELDESQLESVAGGLLPATTLTSIKWSAFPKVQIYLAGQSPSSGDYYFKF